MHIDLNSCFAAIEQQANPHLRGKPIAVAAYTTSCGCIIAPSVEAKKLGIKVGMRVKDGRLLCPELIVLAPDPWKYRNVHLALRRLLSGYTVNLTPKSIDEFVLDLEGYPAFSYGLWLVGKEIKERIKKEIGEWITVSIGIAPNRLLAKLASELNKPDGLDEISKNNFIKVYSKLRLTDLPYIKIQNTIRLNNIGIYNVLDFYHAPLWKLKAAFRSILGYYWCLKIHGWEIDDVAFGRKSYGNSYALPKSFSSINDLSPILSKLVIKMSARFRRAGYKTRGIHLAVSYRDGGFWHKGFVLERELFDSRDIFKRALRILCMSPYRKPVREIAVSCFNLVKSKFFQLGLFEDELIKYSLVDSIDKINQRWGDFVITPARMLYLTKDAVPDRIAFGGVKELEEFSLATNK
ncbi:hypothetical protein A2159_02010 [Candidatus Woesebacteria bacterium RBG_13_34_9]|uniref:UmuC domain-containing protein n=1 Tax=Candidatus Woesebacteria bacterium RBG_13_34_9 TaxID=1802477 RepID=A0A1F7X1Q2_9BACT|nr:MAG: hypothetical protein A2159_02010 [Candidatus Woesebacteria bacterium RBG_13_34_9]